MRPSFSKPTVLQSIAGPSRRVLPPSATDLHLPRRKFHDYLKMSTGDGGYARVPIKSPSKVIGAYSSRGTRSHQEDSYSTFAVQVPPAEIKATLERNHGLVWDPGTPPPHKASQAKDKQGNGNGAANGNGNGTGNGNGVDVEGQLLWVGIYDGHGGPMVSHYLQEHLHRVFEEVGPQDIPRAVEWLKSHGGYFRRWRGGLLQPYIADPTYAQTHPMRLDQRAELAFIECDRKLSFNEEAANSGSTVSVALLKTLEPYGAAFWNAGKISLTVAHCGDTRVLLASTDKGTVTPMTEQHHAEMPRESARLRRMGSGLVTDSFGEARWMGALANTRGLGDGRYKPFGVTPEPDMKSLLLTGSEWSHLVLVSDGVGSMASDQEVVDLARNQSDPAKAARAIVSYVEELGGDDNATAVVVPLPGWGKVQGEDLTRELRAYRREQAVGSERQRRM